MNVLCFDGGGIRGIIPLVYWSLLVKDSKPGIDLLAGTSTGSIIAAGIATGIPLEEIIASYINLGPTLFPKRKYGYFLPNVYASIFTKKSWHYSIENLNDRLLEQLGKTRFKDVKIPLVIPTYNLTKTESYVWRSDKTPQNSTYLHDIVTASCAAPVYFKSMKINGEEYCDGGVVANNPTLAACMELYKKDCRSACILSLGTGTKTGYDNF